MGNRMDRVDIGLHKPINYSMSFCGGHQLVSIYAQHQLHPLGLISVNIKPIQNRSNSLVSRCDRNMSIPLEEYLVSLEI